MTYRACKGGEKHSSNTMNVNRASNYYFTTLGCWVVGCQSRKTGPALTLDIWLLAFGGRYWLPRLDCHS